MLGRVVNGSGDSATEGIVAVETGLGGPDLGGYGQPPRLAYPHGESAQMPEPSRARSGPALALRSSVGPAGRPLTALGGSADALAQVRVFG